MPYALSLDPPVNLCDYTALRAYTGPEKTAYVTGFQDSASPSGIAGAFTLDETDTTSADNGGTIIVASNGKRWKRIFDKTFSLLWFGADPTGATSSQTAMDAARAFLAANTTRYKLVIPSGTYAYTTSPNWAIQNAQIEFQGEVHLSCTGTGNALIFDGGGAGGGVYNVVCKGRPIIEGQATSGHGVYCRNLHHSEIQARVRGCGSTSATFRVEGSVCSKYDFQASVNVDAWVARPAYGIYLTSLGAVNTSDCIFENPILEGINGPGIYADHAIKNMFFGGTSEGNAYGFQSTANASYNTIIGLDMESNSTRDISEAGQENHYLDCLSTTTSEVLAGSVGIKFQGGQYNGIIDAGKATDFDNVSYSSNGTPITYNGTFTSRRNAYEITGAKYVRDKKPLGLEATVSCATGVATTVLTLPTDSTRTYAVHAFVPNGGSASFYAAYAVVCADLTTARILTQVNGTNLTITLSGSAIQVTQTSGGTSNVFAAAEPL